MQKRQKRRGAASLSASQKRMGIHLSVYPKAIWLEQTVRHKHMHCTPLLLLSKGKGGDSRAKGWGEGGLAETVLQDLPWPRPSTCGLILLLPAVGIHPGQYWDHTTSAHRLKQLREAADTPSPLLPLLKLSRSKAKVKQR